MKLLILFSFVCLAYRPSAAQQVRLSMRNAPFRTLLQTLETQSGYTFVYTGELLKKLPAVSLHAEGEDLFVILDKLLKDSGIEYHQEDRFIILSLHKETSGRYMKELKGRVVDEEGAGIAGISLHIKQEAVATLTDSRGYFRLPYYLPGAIIELSGAEFEEASVPVPERPYLEITVTHREKELDETIIIAYGSTTRRKMTGNAVKIGSKELSVQSQSNILALLQGLVPGLLITATGGVPGSSFIAQIRGQNTVNPNPLANSGITPQDQPLILVDGIPFVPQNNPVNQLTSLAAPGPLDVFHNPYGGISSFNDINPGDIESVEILKDADMTAIYGSRAANGIILIHTRQPIAGKPRMEISVRSGAHIAAYRPALPGTESYLQMRRNAFEADSIRPGTGTGDAADLLVFDSGRQTDWYRYFFRSMAPFVATHTRITGGNQRLSFSSGIGTRQEELLLKAGSSQQQFSLNIRAKYQSVNNRFSLEGLVYRSRSSNRMISSPTLLQAILLPPNYPELIAPSGEINWEYKGVQLENNPAGLIRQPYIIHTDNRLSQLSVSYKTVNGINFSINAGHGIYGVTESSFIDGSTVHPLSRNGTYHFDSKSRMRTLLLEPKIQYSRKIEDFRLLLLGGSTFQQNRFYYFNGRSSSPEPTLPVNWWPAAMTSEKRSEGDNYSYASLFARSSLQYRERYLFNITVRREKSSRLSNGRQTGHFGSAAIGWIFSEEPFLKKRFPWLEFGKLRFSYGGTGNDNMAYYHQLFAWASNPSYAANPAASPLSLNESGFSWSVTRKTEFGMELAFCKERLSISMSRFLHRSTDQLISQIDFSVSSQPRYLSNFPAVVRNSGWEFIAKGKIIKSDRLSWVISVNLTAIKNRLSAFPGIEQSLYSGLYRPGYSVSSVPLISYQGVDPVSGLYVFAAGSESMTDPRPWLFGGLQHTFTAGRWKADLMVEFRLQKGANYRHQLSRVTAGFAANQLQQSLDYWRKPGDPASFQRLTTEEGSAAWMSSMIFGISDGAYSNASYVRLHNLHLAYQLKPGRLKIKGHYRTSFFMEAQNLFTLSPFRVTDPETQSLFAYPVSRTISAGIRLEI